MGATDVSRSALLFLSRQSGLKDVASRLGPFSRLAERFVAGETIDAALTAVEPLARKGAFFTFDHLGEDVSEERRTHEEVQEYLRLLQRIDQRRMQANVSIKLTQFGLKLSEDLCLRNARAVVKAAARLGSFVRVDMEGSEVTDATLRVFRALREEFGLDTVGIALQAYLRRTYDDAVALTKLPARIRLCKGAYLEPPEVAFPDKRDVDANYVKVTKLLLSSGQYHGIATHDARMISAAIAHASQNGISPSAFEFQMLYGVRRDLQESLLAQGYRVRVYVPYGESWYPYFMRRLAERPANVWFVLKHLVR